MALRFTGFPLEGLEFFEELEANNDRTWFQAHKAVYEESCRLPMEALLFEIEPEFGDVGEAAVLAEHDAVRARPGL